MPTPTRIAKSITEISVAVFISLAILATVLPFVNLSFLDERHTLQEAGVAPVTAQESLEYRTEFLATIDEVATHLGNDPDEVEVVFHENEIGGIGIIAKVSATINLSAQNRIDVYLPVAVDAAHSGVSARSIALHEYAHILQNRLVYERSATETPIAYTVTWTVEKNHADKHMDDIYGHSELSLFSGAEVQADCFAYTMDPNVYTPYTFQPERICDTPASKEGIDDLVNA